MNCPYCNSIIPDTAEHCTKCGRKLVINGVSAASAPVPEAKAAPETMQNNLRQYAGQAVQQYGQQAAQYGRQVAQQYAGQAFRQATDALTGEASAIAGEYSLGEFGGVLSEARQAAAGVYGAAKNAKGGGFKSGLALLSAIILAVIWVVQLVWKYNGVENPFAGFLNWFTFADGGLNRSIPGFLGGILGKSTVAAALAGVAGGGVMALASGAKRVFSGSNFRNVSIGSNFVGMGIALILYQVFTGEGSLAGIMAAVSGMLVGMRAVAGKAGIFYSFARSFTAKKMGNRRLPQDERISSMLSGVTLGFALAVPLVAVPYTWTHLMAGLVLFFAGLILMVLFGDKGRE